MENFDDEPMDFTTTPVLTEEGKKVLTLMSMPYELISYIMGFVPNTDLLSARLVSHAFRDLIPIAIIRRRSLSIRHESVDRSLTRYEKQLMLDHGMHGFGSLLPRQIPVNFKQRLTSLSCVNVNLCLVIRLIRSNSRTLVSLVIHDPLPTVIEPPIRINHLFRYNLIENKDEKKEYISYPKLKYLICSGFDVNAAKACPNLKTLIIRANLSVLVPKVRIPSVQKFAVVHGFDTMDVSEFLRMNAGNLVEVDIADTGFSFDEELGSPVRFHALQSLACKRISAAAFHSCPSLIHLKLTSINFEADTFDVRWSGSRLQSFEISENSFEQQVSHLSRLCLMIEQMRYLTKLSISCRLEIHKKMGNLFDRLFTRLPLLEDLQLDITPTDGSVIDFDSEIVLISNNCPRLKFISLQGISETDQLLSSLSRMQQLSDISMQ